MVDKPIGLSTTFIYVIFYKAMKSIFILLFLVSSLASLAGEEPVTLKTESGDIYGTLSLPETGKQVPVVLLIAGSGPTDRNGNNPVMTNNSLKMIAEGLAKAGIASLRYDKRGIAASTASMKQENDLRFEDYIQDAADWVKMLKNDSRFSEVIIAGHSEGSLIGMIAAKSRPAADKYISIAGAGQSAGQILRKQLAAQPEQIKELSYSYIEKLEKGDTIPDVPVLLYSLFRPSVQPYMISWLKYDPAKEISSLNIPVLIIQGGSDVQVKKEDADLLASACKNCRNIFIPDMNHVLKQCAIADLQLQMPIYKDPNLPLHEDLMKAITDFIKKENK